MDETPENSFIFRLETFATTTQNINFNIKHLPAVVAQQVKRPEIRSLKEVQLNLHEFDYRSQYRR